MISVYRFLLFLVFLSCDKDAGKTDLLNDEISTAPTSQLPAEEKPLELVWSDEFDGTELNLETVSYTHLTLPTNREV